jgi:hypothetical protein
MMKINNALKLLRQNGLSKEIKSSLKKKGVNFCKLTPLKISLIQAQIAVKFLKNLRAIIAYSNGLAIAGSCSASNTIQP